MKKNVHHIDRIIRIALGIALLVFFGIDDSSYRVFGLLGVIPLMTGLIGFCPLYTLLGINGRACKRPQ